MKNKPTLKDLKAATSVADVAKLLGYKPRSLSYLLYSVSDEQRYRHFEIPKRSGGTRLISAPIQEMKLVQQRLSDLLQDCLDELDQAKGFRTKTSHGFERGRSIVTNALEHRNRRHVFNVDLKDFFGSIHYGRVIGILTKDRSFELAERAAKVLAGIACLKEGLPQGSPCSPVFANLVARVLDSRLRELAKTNKCTYTRYADDLTFSTNLKDFPIEIAVRVADTEHQWEAGQGLKSTVAHCGFQINEDKTRMQYRDSRQEVTGLVVNRKVNVAKEYRKTVRAMVHSLVTKGVFENTLSKKVAAGADVADKKSGTQDQLQGMLGYINLVDTQSSYDASAKDQKDRTITSQVMYQKFLIYKWFYAATVPTILCEGITDNIYLQHAIRSRAKQFPHLTSKAADGSIKLQVRFFRYPQGKEQKTTSTGKILGLSGGSSNVGNFLLDYREAIKGFHEHKNNNPVIVLLDNDKGILPIMSILNQVVGTHQDRDAEFIHVVGNLYVVATKRIKEQPSKIEDFFKPVDKKDLGNKKFNDSNNHNTETEYGKFDFATKVVRANARTIDFSGFDELLTTISNVIQHRSIAVAVKS